MIRVPSSLCALAFFPSVFLTAYKDFSRNVLVYLWPFSFSLNYLVIVCVHWPLSSRAVETGESVLIDDQQKLLQSHLYSATSSSANWSCSAGLRRWLWHIERGS